MKRFLPLLLALALLPLPALAEDASAPVRSAMADLTEVFGYTQEEAEAFTFNVTETDTTWEIEYYDPDHPTWVYTSSTNKETGQYISATTPFKGPDYVRYPGESAVRDGLRTARENGWFTDLSEENRTAFLAWMEQWGVHANDTLNNGLARGTLTGAQALQAFFASCYGDTGTWTDALTEWYQTELASYGWTAEDASAVTAATPVTGINRYESKTRMSNWPVTVTEFADEVPDELSQVLALPVLAGYTCLCGAYTAKQGSETYVPTDTGLLVLEKDGTRFLVAILRVSGTDDWSVQPVGEKALLSGRSLYITYNAMQSEYTLTYPVSDTENESFSVTPLYYDDNEYSLLLRLESYRRTNTATGESVLIAATDDNEWYHVTTTDAAGTTAEEQITRLVPPFLEFTDADAFPKTAEECRADTAYTLPDTYGVSCTVHLRQKTSSRSADLGTYNYGTLLEVLGTEAGDPYPWYHVRIGSVDGYMSSLYVDYEGSACSMRPLEHYPALTVAKTTKSVNLKNGTGWFDGTVATLPAGTKMHVLAEIDGWYHVMIPQSGDPGWLMDVNGTDGYLKQSDVVTAATSLQLDWLGE